MEKTKRKIPILLCVVLIVINIVPVRVNAEGYVDGEYIIDYEPTLENTFNDILFFASEVYSFVKSPTIGSYSTDRYEYCKKCYQAGEETYFFSELTSEQREAIAKECGKTTDDIDASLQETGNSLDRRFTANPDGTITFADWYVEEIMKFLDYYVQQTQPYYIVPGKGANCTWLSSSNSAFNSVTAIGNVRRFCAEKAEQGYQIYSWNHDYYGKLYSDHFVARKADNLYFCKERLDVHTGYGYHGGGGYAPLDADAKNMTDRSRYRILGDKITSEPDIGRYEWVGDYFPADTDFYSDQLVFKTLAGLKEYLLSGKKETVYTGTVYNGDIKNINKTINYNTYVNTDWQKLNDQTYQKIVDAINDQGGNLSRKEIQKIIDDNIAEVTDAIEQSTGDVQKTLNSDTKKIRDDLFWIKKSSLEISDFTRQCRDTLKNIESILDAGFNETIVCNMRTTHNQLDALQTSLVSESAIITKELRECYDVLSEIKNTPGSGYGELDAEKVERLLSSIDVLNTRSLCVDSQILRGLFGNRVDADGVVNVDGGALYDVLVDVRNELKSNGGLMQDIRQIVLDVKSRNININVTTPDDGEGIISRLLNVLSPLTDELKKKFPFSIPWDIGICINLLSAEPEAPVIKYKTKVKAGDKYISGETEIDFKDYKKVRDVAQGFQVVLFAGILIALSRKLFMNGGGNSDS